ncbi:hypothetical protein L1987_79324 [Smallanthus sonchifolius]|uniref:Uncharacterized protein n=1 Tax=Smallanthus sonchifolius TaxID=185202 RepID=A0ACB8ZFG1_9ASTR|nr:hypothetical protein L1987_79324 [Smallanthus sonchifolius]
MELLGTETRRIHDTSPMEFSSYEDIFRKAATGMMTKKDSPFFTPLNNLLLTNKIRHTERDRVSNSDQP